LTHLTSLALNRRCLRPAAAQALREAPFLPGLTALRLFGGAEDVRWVEVLLHCPRLAGLTRLSLSGGMSAAEVGALAGAPHRGHLVSLDLTGACLGVQGLSALASASWPALRDL